MKNFRQLMESVPSRTIVMAFGRFNPPTNGHELLVQFVKKLAKSERADHVIYASRSQDKKKNPLSVAKKLHYLNMMFPHTNFVGANDEQRTFIEVAKFLSGKYKNLIMVAGSDRIPEYTRLLNTYNGKDFHFESIKVVSAGERDPDSDDASGMSASKMRAAATKGDFDTFRKGLPASMREIDGKQLMNDVRVGLGLEIVREHIKLEVSPLRERYFAREIFRVGELVESTGSVYEIVARGSNYLTVVDNQGNTHRKWLQECNVVEAIQEDVSAGYAPDEISYKGYTTKNLHHCEDCAKAFQSTIEKADAGIIRNDPLAIINALKATDEYMAINDYHREAGETPSEEDARSWVEAHTKAKQSLESIGEFMHHMDYWHTHQHELEQLMSNYKETGKSEMSEETVIKSGDKAKVALVIADMLGVTGAEKMTPDQAVEAGLRKVKSKRMTPELLSVVAKMIDLAHQVGIKCDPAHYPAGLKEAVVVDKKKNDNASGDILRFDDYLKLSAVQGGTEEPFKDITDKTKVGHSLGADNDHLRRRKVKYRLGEESDLEEGSTFIPDVMTMKDAIRMKDKGAMLKLMASNRKKEGGLQYSIDVFRKAREKAVKEGFDLDEEFLTTLEEEQLDEISKETKVRYATKAFDQGNKLHDQIKSESDPEKKKELEAKLSKRNQGVIKAASSIKESYSEEEGYDLSDEELDQIANSVTDVEHIVDAYDDEELAVVDSESGEHVDDLKEEVLLEVLSRIERMRAKLRFARTASKRERKLQIALKRRSTAPVINRRARHLAINMIKQRIMKKPVSQMTVAEKERAERIIAKRKVLINRLAMKLAPRVRKVESERLSHHTFTKGA